MENHPLLGCTLDPSDSGIPILGTSIMGTKTRKAREKIFRENKQMFHVNTFLSKHTKEVYNSYSYEKLALTAFTV